MARYLKVTAKEEGRFRGGLQHFGTKFYAEGELSKEQVKLILEEKAFVMAEWVDANALPKDAVVVGEPPAKEKKG
jgi:hypothetical protein